MRRASILALTIALGGCTGLPHLDQCRGAAVRRQVYRAAIAAADAWASGRDPSPAAAIAREAAATALVLLDAHCPAQMMEAR